MFCDETIPAAANAVALGVLRASKQEIPELSLTQLQRFLDSGIPLLQAHATRAVAARPDLEKQTPQLLAAALLLGNAGTRRKIRSVVEAALGAGSTPGAWRRTFAAQLARALEKGDSRRTRTAAQMLAHVFPSEVSDAVVFAHLQTFLEISGENQGWIFERIRKKGESGDLKFLDEIAALPQQFRECVLLEFSRSAAQSKPRAEDAMALVTKSNEAQNRIGWRFLAATNFESGQIQELWKTFSRRYYDEAIFAAAFGEPASAALWRRADWKPDEALLLVNSRGQVWQNFARYFCAEFFAAAIESLPTLKQLDYVFLFIGRTQNAVSEQIFTIFQDAVKTYVPSIAAIRTAFFYSYGWPPMPRSDSEALWKLVAQSQIAPETLRAVWRELWSVQAPATAFGDVAAKVLQRAQIPEADFAEWLPTAPIEKFAPVFFLTVLDLVAAEQKARLLLRPAEAQWQVLQNNVLELLKTAADLRTAFWSGAWQGLESAPDLLARFNHDFLATFNDVSLGAFSALLPSANSAHESLALNWLQTHTDELQRDENLETLIIAATHANDAIRLWGLRAVRERGLSVAVALRLMESGLPQPFALGREYFESAPRNSENERDYALALCDSPAREVQSYGREFLARRASSLLDAAMLQNLAEHPDGQMQSWVAELIKDFPAVQTAEFDTAILRARGKARRAKEKVKTRIGAQAGSTPDMQTGALLELARGSLARDREWALQQLAKRALNGEEIQGVTIK
jgi:hypothetical protein